MKNVAIEKKGLSVEQITVRKKIWITPKIEAFKNNVIQDGVNILAIERIVDNIVITGHFS